MHRHALPLLQWSHAYSIGLLLHVSFHNPSDSHSALYVSLLSQSVTARTLDENGQGNSWTVGTFYQAGDIVTYNGIQYRCLQAYIAAAHWAPDTAFSLWRKIS